MSPQTCSGFRVCVTLRRHLWAACSFCPHNPWIPVALNSARPACYYSCTISIHLNHVTGSIPICFSPVNKTRFPEADWSLWVDFWLINMTEGFRQYISDHLLLQRVSFQLAAPLLHSSCNNEKEFFNIVPLTLSCLINWYGWCFCSCCSHPLKAPPPKKNLDNHSMT